MLGTPSFSQPYLCIQPAVQSPPKICFLIQSIFTFLFYSYLFTKSSLKPPLTILSFIPQQFLTSLFLRITIPAIHTKNIFQWYNAHNHQFCIPQTQKIDILQVWKTIQLTFSHTLHLLSLLPYPTNTTKWTPIPLKTSCLTWFSS